MLDVAARGEIRNRAARINPEAAWCEVVHEPAALLASDGRTGPASTLTAHDRVAAFCGIGNPAGFRHTLAEASGLGCIIRDLELGLVDFYTMAGGRIVCLCWRRGEPKIEHWHPVDEGFSGRRPLEDLA